MNVRHLSILPLALLISGCGSLWPFGKSTPEVKQVQIQTKAVEKTPLKLPDPAPLQARNIKFLIITRENYEQTFEELAKQGIDPVVFALTDDGYAQLSMTIAEVRNLLATQRSIIMRYREYYEPEKKEEEKK